MSNLPEARPAINEPTSKPMVEWCHGSYRKNNKETFKYYNKRKWKTVQIALMSFWQIWIREYLPIITTHKKWNIPTRNFVIGDLVLIADKNIPRSNWLLARITEMHRSKDNVTRVVKLKNKIWIIY